jgi:phosphatidylglycerophosphatase C
LSLSAADNVAVGVAAFDFDGTLIPRDSFVPFLLRVTGRRSFGQTLVGSSASMLRAYGVKRNRDASKAALVARLLRGYPAERLTVLGQTFGAELAGRLRPAMAERIDWHREQGHRLVLVSASLDVYLEPLGQRLGFDGVLATSLEVGEDGLLTGRLQGANVRGVEKVARLRSWMAAHLGDAPVELWAYGDSAGDRQLLAMADHPLLVGRAVGRTVGRRTNRGASAAGDAPGPTHRPE